MRSKLNQTQKNLKNLRNKVVANQQMRACVAKEVAGQTDLTNKILVANSTSKSFVSFRQTLHQIKNTFLFDSSS